MKKILFLFLLCASLSAIGQVRKTVLDWTPSTAKDTSFYIGIKNSNSALFVTVYGADSLWMKVQHSAYQDSLYVNMPMWLAGSSVDSIPFISGKTSYAIELDNKKSLHTKVVINQVGTTKPTRVLIDHVPAR
jgi:hypothetical protein